MEATRTQQWTADPIPDAGGFTTIRPYDGSENGDTDSQPIATFYDDDAAVLGATAPALLAACEASELADRVREAGETGSWGEVVTLLHHAGRDDLSQYDIDQVNETLTVEAREKREAAIAAARPS